MYIGIHVASCCLLLCKVFWSDELYPVGACSGMSFRDLRNYIFYRLDEITMFNKKC